MQVCLRPPFIFVIPALLQLFPAIFAELATCNGECELQKNQAQYRECSLPHSAKLSTI
jgi:uncharacterized membrane protein YjjB (DUF3815 family)